LKDPVTVLLLPAFFAYTGIKKSDPQRKADKKDPNRRSDNPP